MTAELAFERRRDAIKSGLFYGLPVTLILEPRPKYAHCTTSKADFFPRDFGGTFDTAPHKLPQKGNETHTHTEGERMLPTAKFMLPSKQCYAATNWATGTKEMFFKKSIFISVLAIRRYITFI